jgi:hypothetical protein
MPNELLPIRQFKKELRRMAIDAVAEVSKQSMQDGDTFTIKGVRTMNNGRIVTKCKEGLETVYTARIPKD